MTSISAGGLIQLTYEEVKQKISSQKLFGLDPLRERLFRFCKFLLTANDDTLKSLKIYDLALSILLYGPPNTGKTTLCYLIFDQLKQEVTNEINFYFVDIGGLLDPSLGQSSRNLKQIFQDLQDLSQDNSSAFLLLDELDTFCMSRSRAQEHDGVRRAMTTLMQEIDSLNLSLNKSLIVFGITNVINLIDTAVVRRFAVKEMVNVNLSFDDFKCYIDYLSKPINYQPNANISRELYEIYKKRQFTTGDIKGVYKDLVIDVLCSDNKPEISERIIELFQKGFSTHTHLQKTQGGLN